MTTTTITTTKPETAQMTIFYAGQVLVFNDLPSDKAEEVMALARKGSSNVNGSVSVTVSTPVKDKIDSATVININASPEPEELDIKNASVSKSDQILNNKFPTPERSQERPAEPASGSGNYPLIIIIIFFKSLLGTIFFLSKCSI